jgi:hypothetical protein
VGPGLERTAGIGDQDPIGADLRFELVGLVQQVGPLSVSHRLADTGDVDRHLNQRRRELQQSVTAPVECIPDG